jgi:hypothetical protein
MNPSDSKDSLRQPRQQSRQIGRTCLELCPMKKTFQDADLIIFSAEHLLDARRKAKQIPLELRQSHSTQG